MLLISLDSSNKVKEQGGDSVMAQHTIDLPCIADTYVDETTQTQTMEAQQY